MAKDHLIEKSLAREMANGVDSTTIGNAYAFYINIGGQADYYEFRRQAKKDLKTLLQSIETRKEV